MEKPHSWYFLVILEQAAIIQILTTDQNASNDKAAYEKTINRRFDLEMLRLSLVDDLEIKLLDIETNRSKKITNQIESFSIRLKELKYHHPLIVDKMIERECSIMNLKLIENQSEINSIIKNLKKIAFNADQRTKEYHEKFGIDWKQSRYEYTFSAFSKSVKEALDVDFDTFYATQNEKFIQMVNLQKDLIFEIANCAPDETKEEWLAEWRKKADESVNNVTKLIKDASNMLHDLEIEMDRKSDQLYLYWLPLIQECSDVEVSRTMRGSSN